MPIFNPDLEGALTPESVLHVCNKVDDAEAVIISCPEYVRANPGGLKNMIDWLVSRDEITIKSVALVHASNRGEGMLDSLRLVMTTVTERFAHGIFMRIPLNSISLHEARAELSRQENSVKIVEYLKHVQAFVDDL